MYDTNKLLFNETRGKDGDVRAKKRWKVNIKVESLKRGIRN